MGVFGMYGRFEGGTNTNLGNARAAARAESKSQSVESEMKHLEATVEKLLMINEALWEFMRDKHGMTDTDLHKKIYEIDMRDGSLDGKNKRKASKCPGCGRMVSSRHPACLYCGEVMDSSVFTME